MLSPKRHLIEDSTWNARPTKRQVPPIADDGDSTQSPQYLSQANFSSDPSPRPSVQDVPWSLSDSDGLESCTPFPSTPGLVGEVCFGMICCVKTQFLDDPSIATIHPGLPTRRSTVRLGDFEACTGEILCTFVRQGGGEVGVRIVTVTAHVICTSSTI
ncbi:uncharacterized protein BDR25DRAFT_62991 [Lindgomyces ingoldianus]|uniref:Uncharacterized protein n=1 Tax=Lindgomyces ingoldianus TaxID=673940 RepID=A0ACB6QN07_9PLEO|nr:uncharacterized protein BDR25DRAFT_62991 [Lindgomyces ingoldianus]KAF2467495.1 hypothetical protein BDR25DRAFT_62991 [Lindgomyces ingoldianus]